MKMLRFCFSSALFSFAALTACKSTSRDSEIQSLSIENRSDEIWQDVNRELETTHKESKGKLWSASRGAVQPDWIVASPEGYWGLTQDQFPKNYECTPGSTGCDDVFARKVCSADDECASMNTKCRVLEASASASRPARTMCLSPADKLLDRFYRTMISAETYLDVTSLSMPSGVFRPAFINALTILDQKATPPTVRILLSGEEVLNINQGQPAQDALQKIWIEMRKAGNLGEEPRMLMNMGYISWQFSWNHSKIIIADKQRMLQGGHNMWGDPYLISRPVSDLSMEVYGPIVGASQNFVDNLWAENAKLKKTKLLLGAYFGSLPKGTGEIANPQIPAAGSGSIPMIAVGRMGTFGPNPSDDASKAMIRSAKHSIDFIVQDLYGLISNLKIVQAKPWTFNEIAEALMRGVHLRVIQSDTDVGPNDYTLIKYQGAHKLLIQNVVDYASSRGFKAPGGQSPRAYFCGLVQYAPIRYVEGQTRWDKQKGYGSHAKLLMVDDAAFYMGSHNYYAANLQEFGVIVADQALTRQLQKAYWEPIWNVSQHSVALCN